MINTNSDTYNQLLKSLSQNLKQFRKDKSLTQRDVASLCNMDEQNYRRIENAKVSPTLKSLHRISEALNISLSELLQVP